MNGWNKRCRRTQGELLFLCVGCVVLSRMHASGSHLKKCLPFLWINEQLGRTGQGGAICKCHRHCLLILHIIKANIPNLYQSNQEQAITATGAPGEPRPNSERKEQWEREKKHTIYLTHIYTHFYTHTLKQARSTPSNDEQTHEISTSIAILIASSFNNRAEWKQEQFYKYLWAVCIEPKWESCYSFSFIPWHSES